MDAKLVVVSGAARAAEFKLKLPTIIGRSRAVDLPVGHPLVSRQHCELFAEGSVLKIRDLGSLNGTFVNEERIAEDTVLAPGATFSVGPLTFKAVYAAPASDAPAEADEGELNFPDDSAEVPSLAANEDEPPAAAAAEEEAAPGMGTVHTAGIGTVNDQAPVTGEEDDSWLTEGDSAASPAADGATGALGEDDFLIAETPGDAFDTSFDSAVDIPRPAASPSPPPAAEKPAAKAKKAAKAKPAPAKPAAAKPAAAKPAKPAETPAPAASQPEEEMDFAPPPREGGQGHADDLDNLLDFLQ